jgi:AraC-like DNA-binding protein
MLIHRSPAAALAPFVDAIWLYESVHAHSRELVLPHGRCQLLVNLETGLAFVRGASTKPTLIDPSEMRRMVGVLFRPAGSFAITGVSAMELQDGAAALSDLIPRVGSELAPQLAEADEPSQLLTRLEAWLLARGAQPTAELRTLTAATRALEAGVSVAAAVDEAGTSRSSLLRRFSTHVGTTPKQYARLSRFQRVVRALATGEDDLAQLALRAGYADQAHLCHEFREFAGRTPTDYRPRDPSEPNHIVV